MRKTRRNRLEMAVQVPKSWIKGLLSPINWGWLWRAFRLYLPLPCSCHHVGLCGRCGFIGLKDTQNAEDSQKQAGDGGSSTKKLDQGTSKSDKARAVSSQAKGNWGWLWRAFRLYLPLPCSCHHVGLCGNAEDSQKQAGDGGSSTKKLDQGTSKSDKATPATLIQLFGT
jgi:ubiquitin